MSTKSSVAEPRDETKEQRALRCEKSLAGSVTPFGDTAFALRDPTEDMVGEIHLPNQAKRNKQTATIVSIGPKQTELAVGDRVILLGGYKVEFACCGWNLEIVSTSDIAGTIRKGANV